MTDSTFEERLAILTFLLGEDAFADEYERLLNAVRELPAGRFEKLSRMKKVLLLEVQSTMNEWLQATRGRTIRIKDTLC